MEPKPRNPDFSEYEKFATDLYDDVDWLFTVRKVPSWYEHFDDRHCQLELTQGELDVIAPILLSYAIDPPTSLKITLMGRNPFIYKNTPHGVLWIETEHESVEKNTIASEYTVWLDCGDVSPVNACKDVKRRALAEEPSDRGLLALPLNLGDIYFSNAPIGADEQRALRATVAALGKINNPHSA